MKFVAVNKIRVALLLASVLVLASPLLSQQPTAPNSPATKEDILKLFRVMDTQDQMRQVMQQVIQEMGVMNREELKRRHSGVSEDDLARMDQEFKEVAKAYPVDQLMEDMVPVYQKHLTKADVDAMIAFYSSPTGKKLLHEMPAMTSEGIQAAYPRMQKNLDEIMKRLDEKTNQPQPETSPAQKLPAEQN